MLNRRSLLAVLAAALAVLMVGWVGASSPRIVSAWGDSLTRGSGARPGGGYPEQIAAVAGRVVENHGIGGQTGDQILARMVEADDLDERVVIIWAGRNDVDGANTEAIVETVGRMVALTDATHYLVLSLTNGQSEPRGTANYETIVAVNARLAEIHGDRFVDVRSALVAVPDPSDTAAADGDYVAGMLRSDDIHFNDIGYQIVADAVLTRLETLGW